MAASSARVVAHIQHHAADIGLVRDLGRQRLDHDRIGKGQGGRLLDRRHRARSTARAARRCGRAARRLPARRAFRRCRAACDRTSIGLGACRCNAAATASAQASGVWKLGTPAAASRASASGASGTRNAAIGFCGAGAVDDRLDREIGIEPRRGADHDHDQIELRRGGQHVERALHHLVLRAGEREIDDPRRRDVDAGRGLDARQRLRRRRLDRDAARRERIDHHGGAAGGGGDHGDGRPPRAARGGPARARSSGKPSISPSSVSTRAMPHSARNMPAMSSSPASAPVCETASSRAAAERPSL